MSFQNILQDFYLKLEVPEITVEGVEVLNPYTEPETRQIVDEFFSRYYNDNDRRILLVGINPGRFGAGVTGVGFTDPINLENHCAIPNQLEKKPELSSVFMYKMIEAMGGAEVFFRYFLFSSVSPLGFVKDGRNLNYYDIPELRDQLEMFMVTSLKQQIQLGGSGEMAFCIGMGANYKYLKQINAKYRLFKKLDVLPHPRWVLQYRRKKIDEYINEYVQKLGQFVK